MTKTDNPITTKREDLEKLNSLLLIGLIRSICIIHAMGESHAMTMLDILESRIAELEAENASLSDASTALDAPNGYFRGYFRKVFEETGCAEDA